MLNTPWSYVINRIFWALYQASYENLWKENFQSPLLTFVSGPQTIPAPSGASSLNVPTHVILLCAVPTYIHLLHVCAPTSVCCIRGHPYIFFSLQSQPILPNHYQFLLQCYYFKILSLSRFCVFLIFFSILHQYFCLLAVMYLQLPYRVYKFLFCMSKEWSNFFRSRQNLWMDQSYSNSITYN